MPSPHLRACRNWRSRFLSFLWCLWVKLASQLSVLPWLLAPLGVTIVECPFIFGPRPVALLSLVLALGALGCKGVSGGCHDVTGFLFSSSPRDAAPPLLRGLCERAVGPGTASDQAVPSQHHQTEVTERAREGSRAAAGELLQAQAPAAGGVWTGPRLWSQTDMVSNPE